MSSELPTSKDGAGRPTLGLAERFRPPPPSARFYLAVVLTSVAAAGFAVILRGLLDGASELALGSRNLVEGFRGAPPWVRLVGPVLGAALGALVSLWAARRLPPSGGVSAVMEAVVLGRVALSLRASLAKATASFLAIVGGGSLGREGPLIQVGAALGSTVAGRMGFNSTDARLLVAAGTAAGFASAYNTPLAATLFVSEIVTGALTLELVVPVLVAAAIGTVLSRLALGAGPIFGARTFTLVEPEHIALAIALGPLGGVLGAGFAKLLAMTETLFLERVRHTVVRASVGGLIVGLTAVALPDVVGNGAEPLRAMLDGRVTAALLAVLLLAKPMATAASVGSGSTGGVFTPTMFLGAAMGGLLGSLTVGGAADVEPVVGALALVGMAAVVAATTHAPLMATVLAFELSGDYALVVPSLAASALAAATARLLGQDSIYVAEARRTR